ncbi:MAG: hypothetical protein EON58_05915 [Alphaproteobacteria bacterium]|nr:MAG: hypothetical protein EON58_05915 [Alphaproteobacteria bacterium]
MASCLILGNSHVAALAAAQNAGLAATSFDRVEFIAAPRDQLKHLVVESGRLVASDESLRMSFDKLNFSHSVDPRDFDIIVVCGLGLGLRRLMRLYVTHYADTMRHDPGRRPLSDDCFQQALVGLMGRSLAWNLIEKISELGSSRMTLVPEPAPSSEVYSDHTNPGWALAKRNGDIDVLGVFYAKALDVLTKGRASLVLPKQPLEDAITSAPRYSSGSVRLTNDLTSHHDKADLFHMNAEYGALVMATLSSIPQHES